MKVVAVFGILALALLANSQEESACTPQLMQAVEAIINTCKTVMGGHGGPPPPPGAPEARRRRRQSDDDSAEDFFTCMIEAAEEEQGELAPYLEKCPEEDYSESKQRADCMRDALKLVCPDLPDCKKGGKPE